MTRKVGGAVVRNRIKRRLRSAIASSQALGFQAGNDYVLIARHAAATIAFDALTASLEKSLKKVHASTRREDKNGQRITQASAEDAKTDEGTVAVDHG